MMPVIKDTMPILRMLFGVASRKRNIVSYRFYMASIGFSIYCKYMYIEKWIDGVQ